MLPEIKNYGNYSSDNYGAHTLCIITKDLELFYSYKTIVAFRDVQDGLVCSENVWGVTTGKHLNWIQPDKTKRTKNLKFEEMLKLAIERHII